jgi:polysaccharide biosynthesis/export protein
MRQNTPVLSRLYISVICCSILLVSCGTSKKNNTSFTYFLNGSDTVLSQQKELVIQCNDLLSIQVYSQTLNQEQAAVFNMQPGGNASTAGLQVTPEGNIEMPVIGNVKAAGLTKTQLKAVLVTKLSSYVKNPIVLVRLLQFNVNVLGEVRLPGTQKFQADRVTIIDALSAAGDLTDYGKREDITVIREVSDRKIYYTIDLRRKNIFESPVYLLQPNDIVYVGPNKNKLRNLSVNPDTQRKTGLFFGALSAILSVATLVLFSVKN